MPPARIPRSSAIIKTLNSKRLIASDTQKRKAFRLRIDIIHGILLVILLVIVARLIELQIIRGKEYESQARSQHFGGIVLPAKRGEILSRNSKTNELNIFATNTTLDLLYVDPFVTKDKRAVAEVLAQELLTDRFDSECRSGSQDCPRELRTYYSEAFNPLSNIQLSHNSDNASFSTTGTLLQPVITPALLSKEDIVRRFMVDIEQRISEEFVSFVPLLYGATKIQLQTVQQFGIPGIYTSDEQKLVYANPLHVPDYERVRIARILSPTLSLDTEFISDRLRQRRLRYVPIMRQLPPEISKRIKKIKEESAGISSTDARNEEVSDPLRGIALIPEHWRFYPDGTVGCQVVGFLNTNQQAQNGVERTFDYELRGQEGRISALTDPFGGQIVSEDQSVVQARDGKSVILTIDRYLQKQVETILQKAVIDFDADSGQVIVMDPETGKIIVMANAPLFDSNDYSIVYEKVPFSLSVGQEAKIVVEIYNPQTNELVIRSYLNDLSLEGRTRLSKELQSSLNDLEREYDLEDLIRYYWYLGENSRIELFPFKNADGIRSWLKYKNRIGVGAYVNRTIQEVYEPGSVFKPITLAIAIDQGELLPEDEYIDEGLVEVDEFKIENAYRRVFGKVTITDCISFSINTCMTYVSRTLGKKLFANYIERFGFGRITAVQLEGEKTGQVLDWRRWSDALLATAAFGQGISATPLQVATAYAALANGGKLVKPTIIDSWIESDGTVKDVHPQVLDQVITEESSSIISAILVNGVNEGFARRAKVAGYRIAGKTGTSQIAGPGGKYEKTVSGSTIATFAGYAPVDHPRFVILVKFDRPRTKEDGSQTAAPVFKDIAEIFFEYYGIPPDEI